MEYNLLFSEEEYYAAVPPPVASILICGVASGRERGEKFHRAHVTFLNLLSFLTLT